MREREKYTPRFKETMPEISEESDEAARAGGQRALWHPLLRVIGSARAVAFSMNVQMSRFPQLPLARDSKVQKS